MFSTNNHKSLLLPIPISKVCLIIIESDDLERELIDLEIKNAFFSNPTKPWIGWSTSFLLSEILENYGDLRLLIFVKKYSVKE